MRLSTPLDDLFQARSHIKVLRALDRLPPGIDFSIREIARRAGVTHPTASAVLESFRKQGIVRVRRTVWADQVQVNPAHSIWKRLRPLLRWERHVRDEIGGFIASQIGDRAPWVTAAYVFGSANRDDMDPDSDIDVALIVPRNEVGHTKTAMSDVADLAADRFGNRVNIVIGSGPIEELAKAGRPGARLWRAIAKEGTRIVPRAQE